MKLLFDQNLSYKLCQRLAALFPDSQQVKLVNLAAATDERVWQYARDKGYVIVTKDSDFVGLSALHGHPPKVIRLKCGNQSTRYIADILIGNHKQIEAFLQQPNIGYLEIE